ncbi:MAG: PEGA domain-containing protein [Polyangiaceae bacterium]|nr:PEGA domain-containing protein [Polyangiaceae bacterium]
MMLSRHQLGRALLRCVGLLVWLSVAQAQPSSDLARAKEYFRAGAQAYAVGEFDAAVQAFEQAYALVPRPAVLFSIGQAERRQYFLDHQRQHLERAVQMFQKYLEQDPQASRKVDAVQALSELEPLLVQTAPARPPEPEAPAPPPAAPTRIMVYSAAPGAQIALDGQDASPSPLVREVAPGKHSVRVSAPGFVDSERQLLAIQGALVSFDVVLKELPANLTVIAPAGAELRINGRVQGECPFPRPIELAPGKHLVTLTKNGFDGVSREEQLGRGENRVLRVRMKRSTQRTAALVMFGASASGVVAGGIFTYFAFRQQASAQAFLDERGRAPLTPEDRRQYESNRLDRDRLRLAAGLFLGSGVAFGVGGTLLFLLDEGALSAHKDKGPDSSDRKTAGRWSVAPSADLGQVGVRIGTAF